MGDIEKRDKGLLLRLRPSELERIDRARGALSRGRWVRALVLDGLLAQEQIGPGVAGVLRVPVVEGSEKAQLKPASALIDYRSVRPPRSGVFGAGVPSDSDVVEAARSMGRPLVGDVPATDDEGESPW